MKLKMHQNKGRLGLPLGELRSLPQTLKLDSNLLAPRASIVRDYAFWFLNVGMYGTSYARTSVDSKYVSQSISQSAIAYVAELLQG